MDNRASDDAGHWAELQRLFHRCDGLDATAIEALLAREVADAALRERVRALLRSAQPWLKAACSHANMCALATVTT